MQVNSAMFRRRYSQRHSAILRAKLLERYTDLREGLTHEKMKLWIQHGCAMLQERCYDFCRQSEHIH